MGNLPPAKQGRLRVPEAHRDYGGHTYSYYGFTQNQAEARADRHVANIEKLDQELKAQRGEGLTFAEANRPGPDNPIVEAPPWKREGTGRGTPRY